MWRLIDTARRGSPDASLVAIEQSVAKLSAPARLKFAEELGRLFVESNSIEVWGAAYVINGGCSDDCFSDFQEWLIVQGRDTFDGAMQNPDSLAALPGLRKRDTALKGLRDVANGSHDSEGTIERGPDWNFDDAAFMREKYPGLLARFGPKGEAG